MATYLVCFSPETSIRMFKAWAVFLGFILHLALDELYSVDLMGRRLKKSWGTAMKFFGKDSVSNIVTYGKVALLAFMIYNDAYVMECCRYNGPDTIAESKRDEERLHFQVLEPEYLQGLFERPETSDSVRR